jgi:hypothetical protein
MSQPRSSDHRSRNAATALLAALVWLAGHPARGQGFDRDVDDSCIPIPAQGGNHVLVTSDPIPAGKTVLVDIVYTDAIALRSPPATDDAGNTYAVAASATDQTSVATAVVGQIQHPLSAGQQITLSYDAAGSGTSCALAYRVDGISGGLAGRDVSSSNTGTGGLAQVSILDGQLSQPGEFVQTVFFARPVSGDDVTGTINVPLVDQNSFCIGTIDGPMCRLSAYGVLPTTGAFTASLSLTASAAWGAALVSYLLVPEPEVETLMVAAVAALAALARVVAAPPRMRS